MRNTLEQRPTPHHMDREAIRRELTLILEDMTRDWELTFSGGIKPDTCLIGDLTFQSIDIVQLLVAIEEHFKRRTMPFETLLMSDGRYVDELRVGQVVDFLHEQMNLTTQ